MFQPTSFRGLAADNNSVKGVHSLSLDKALRMVGQDQVATVFGLLRPGVVAVDVDMARGEAVVGDLVAWCVQADLWHVVRRSGQEGHAHVLIVVGDRRAELGGFCERLRAAYGVSGKLIDIREEHKGLRPLSAPHRLGTTPPLPAGLARAARALPAALRVLPPATAPTPVRARTGIVSLVARPLPRSIKARDLPADWADYFVGGYSPGAGRWLVGFLPVDSGIDCHMADGGRRLGR